MKCGRTETGTLDYGDFEIVEVLDQTYDCPHCGETLCYSEEDAKKILENRGDLEVDGAGGFDSDN